MFLLTVRRCSLRCRKSNKGASFIKQAQARLTTDRCRQRDKIQYKKTEKLTTKKSIKNTIQPKLRLVPLCGYINKIKRLNIPIKSHEKTHDP